MSALPKLMPKPKWFENDKHLKEGDIVIFDKDEGDYKGKGSYQYGMVEKVHTGRDGIIRSVTIKYRNSTEQISRSTHRAVRGLTVIHRVDEINLMEELGKASLHVDSYYCHQTKCMQIHSTV